MVLLEGYSLTATVYQSGGTVVCRGTRASDGAPVICKLLGIEYPSAAEISSFRREYEIAAKLQGDGAVKVYGLEKANNSLAIIMEDFGGESLSRSPGLKEAGIGEKLAVAAEIANALSRIHRKNIIHKDINPSNIVRNPETGELKIIDLGIATELTREAASFLWVGAMEGTLGYISPEQTGRMNRPIDYRTDLYSVGVTLYELFTGRLPFAGDDPLDMVYSHIARVPPSPRAVNPELPGVISKLILKLLAKAPEDRYQSASGLLADIKRCREELVEKGRIDDFSVGQLDWSSRFTLSNRLYGRDHEIAVLQDSLREVTSGSSGLVLVAGAPGVGKTSLIQEIQKSLPGSRGFLISGKFNQLDENIPYSALLQAFGDLLDQVLSSPSERLTSLKGAILQALGTNAGVLVELLPKLEHLLGPQPAPPPLDPVAAHNRLQLALRSFIQAFVSEGRPLVLFLDDLQWSDPPTVELITYLRAAGGIPRLLLVGAYRNNEVREGHPLHVLLKSLEDHAQDPGLPCRKLFLEPLGIDAVNQLLADTLRSAPEATRGLTAIVHGKTGGNPFFTNQMLTSLYAQGAFSYSTTENRWTWDRNQVVDAELSDNIVDFLVRELQSLPPPTKAILKLAACIGSEFDLKTLSALYSHSRIQLNRGLWQAIAKEVIVPLNRNYRLLSVEQGDGAATEIEVVFKFQHDRLLQAMHAMISEEEKTAIHHRIGRAMLQAARNTEAGASLFALVNHLNIGRAHVAGREERLELAELNATAGRKAMASTAFKTAAAYFETARSLLSSGDWEDTPGKRFSLSLQHAESVFLGGDPRAADRLTLALFEMASGKMERAAVCHLKSRILESQGDLNGAIDEIRKSLRPFGLCLPETQPEIEQRVGEGLGKMQQGFARVPIDALVHLGEMKDAEKVVAMRLLAQVVPAAIQSNYALYMVTTMMMVELTLTEGLTAESCKCIADSGIIYSAVLGDHDTGYRLGKAAFALIDRLKTEWQKPAVCFSFTYVSHMRKHFREGLDHYEMSYQSGMAVGDTQHAAYARAHKAHLMMWVGANLRECRRETEATISFLKESQALVQLMLANIVLHTIRKLEATPDRAQEEELARVDDEIMAAVGQSKNVVLLGRFSQYNAFVHYVLGDLQAAQRWNDIAESVVFAAGTDFPLADHFLVQSLLGLARLRTGAVPDREATLARVSANLAKLECLANNCPENFAHKFHLLSAELSAFRGDPLEVTIALYEQAVASIGKGDFPQMVGLINERQGAFWIARHNDTLAKAFLREAHYQYGQWGSLRKVAVLEHQYRDYFVLRDETPASNGDDRRSHRPGHSVSNAALDMSSIIKSTQAISGEIRTENLLRTLLHTIIENAGAQSGCLLLSGGSPARLSIVASKESGSDTVELVDSRPYTASDNLCSEIIEYVERTRESVVLNHAAAEGSFRTNPHIRARGIKSVLCMPVIHQQTLKGMVYLENSLSDHVFTTERLKTLSILASQASISIENARLYEEMESKVRERTRLLHQANDRLKQLTLIDPLTRLNNRRYFHEHIAHTTENYVRGLGCAAHERTEADGVMGVFLVDIDRFKEVNDTWGHAAGDTVLMAISQTLRSIVRAEDFIVRWGGEEFLVILNDTSPAYLDRFARKALRSVRENAISLDEGRVIRRTCSIGYTQVPFCQEAPELLTLEQTIRLSDYAMYVAKQSGRDRAVHVSLKPGRKADDALRSRLLALAQDSSLTPDLIELRHVRDDD